MDPVVSSFDLERLHVTGNGDDTLNWLGAFVTYGEHGATQSSIIVYEIEPGGHLGWHTDQTEESQYIVSGTGELHREDGVYPIGPGSVFVLPFDVRHDVCNTGTETLRAVAFFAAPMFTQKFDTELLPLKSKVAGTPNRAG